MQDLGAGLNYYQRRLRSSPKDVAFTDVKGKPWTFEEVSAAQQRHPLAASQTAAELDTSNLEYLTELMQKGNYLYKFSPFAARSYVGRFADYTDRIFRQAVFVNGLQRGQKEIIAAREGKDAALDYQRARSSQVNRGIGQALMFWSFQSESLRATMDSLWRDPKDIINTYRVLRAEQQRADMEASGSNVDQARILRKRIQGFDKEQNIVAGFAIPALESFGLAAEGMGVVVSAFQDDVSLTKLTKRQTALLLDRASFRPSLRLALELSQQKGLGLREGKFVPANYVSGIPDWAWPTYRAAFNIEMVPVNERRKGKASRYGEQYRFASTGDETAHLLFQQILFAAGLQRRFEDSLRTAGIVTYPSAERIPYPYGEEHSLLEGIIYEAGVQTYLSDYGPERQLGLQKARVRSELQTQK